MLDSNRPQEPRMGKIDNQLNQYPNYKPLPLRWPFIASLFILICIVLGLLEHARHVLPLGVYSHALVALGSSASPSIARVYSTKMPNSIVSHHKKQLSTIGAPLTSNLGPKPTSLLALNVATTRPTPTIIKATNIWVNGTEVVTSGIPSWNQTSPFTPPSDVKDPSDYAYYNFIGPKVRVKLRCPGETGLPGEHPIVGVSLDGVPGEDLLAEPGLGCFSIFILWPSTDTGDCLAQWRWVTGSAPSRPPTFDPANTSPPGDSGAWILYWGSDDGDCPFPTLADMQRCHEYCDESPTWGLDAFRAHFAVSTTFQFQQVAPTTIETILSDGSLSTMTTNFTRIVTATGLAEGRQSSLAGPPTTRLSTLTDSSGRPTATVAEIFETLTDLNGIPTETKTVRSKFTSEPVTTAPIGSLATVVNSNGMPINTIRLSLATLTDSAGRPTATITAFVTTDTTIQPPQSTSKDSNGKISNQLALQQFRLDKPGTYFIAAFLPVLISIIISSIIQVFDKNLKTMLPFVALTKAGGAAAMDSLCFTSGGFTGPLHSLRLLTTLREPISLLCDVLVLLTAVLVSISSEAIGISIDYCYYKDSSAGCYMYFSIFNGPSRAAEILLIIMAIIIAWIGLLIQPRRTGIARNPWTIASTASLLSEEVNELFHTFSQVDREERNNTAELFQNLKRTRFALGPHSETPGNTDYGIIVLDHNDAVNRPAAKQRTKVGSRKSHSKRGRTKLTQFITDYGVRALFMGFLCGVLILIVYYDSVQLDANTDSFEGFIDSQKFGVRSLFTGFGVIISFFWDNMFAEVTKLQPYKDLSRLPRRSNSALSAPLATTVFPGLWTAIRDRNTFLGTVAFAGVLSKITPLLLSNIPFRTTQTWQTQKVCAWTTTTILAFMILVLLRSFFVKWPYMPVDPSTIAGNVYYLYESPVRNDFKQTSRMEDQQWKTHLRGAGKDYRFKKMVGLSGQSRTGIYRETALES